MLIKDVGNGAEDVFGSKKNRLKGGLNEKKDDLSILEYKCRRSQAPDHQNHRRLHASDSRYLRNSKNGDRGFDECRNLHKNRSLFHLWETNGLAPSGWS